MFDMFVLVNEDTALRVNNIRLFLLLIVCYSPSPYSQRTKDWKLSIALVKR